MARSECAPCKIVFTGVTAFDLHLRDNGLRHVHPSQIPGLVQRPDGAWGEDRPRDDAAIARLKAASDRGGSS